MTTECGDDPVGMQSWAYHPSNVKLPFLSHFNENDHLIYYPLAPLRFGEGRFFGLKGRFWCACEVVVSARCESSSRNVWFLVAEGHCVAAKRGGEQPEANVRSVG
jgi:hypothetical protein